MENLNFLCVLLRRVLGYEQVLNPQRLNPVPSTSATIIYHTVPAKVRFDSTKIGIKGANE